MNNSSSKHRQNIDSDAVKSFGYEWKRHNQSDVSKAELLEIFEDYFSLFPWPSLPDNAEGFDMGCGSGRWAGFVAPRVAKLNCIDPSVDELNVAKQNLAGQKNVTFINASVDAVPLQKGSQDFGYSLGVLHHVPQTAAAIGSCADLLKPGAPLLLYLYYRFDNKPWWFKGLWQLTNLLRLVTSKLSSRLKSTVTDVIAVIVYWPLARLALLMGQWGMKVEIFPLSAYRDKSLCSMSED